MADILTQGFSLITSGLAEVAKNDLLMLPIVLGLGGMAIRTGVNLLRG